MIFAHGGRLNGDGCHRENKTGGVHCHRSASTTLHSRIEPTKGPYRREEYAFIAYKTFSDAGFYTDVKCKTSVDHVVSLKDAHESGAALWSQAQKKVFSNDRRNHVAACSRINSSKGASTPEEFLRKSDDEKGLEYEIKNFCRYLEIYYIVKEDYGLSFANNNRNVFKECGLTLD
jgi:5-methylcytosine-specific restriction endonuclease McrA